MIITLHPPPHHPPPRNSNSTRNNGPRGLKFCMQPHQAKLTTTQHNFNPTIFWGGGSYILPLGLTLPGFLLTKKISDPILFDRNFFWPQIFWPQIFLTLRFFSTKNLFDPKIFVTQKNFYRKFIWPKKFLTQYLFNTKFFWPKILLTQKFFWPKIFFWPKFFLTWIFFIPNFFDPKNTFRPKIYIWAKNIFNSTNFFNLIQLIQFWISFDWAWHYSVPACYFCFISIKIPIF